MAATVNSVIGVRVQATQRLKYKGYIEIGFRKGLQRNIVGVT